MGGATSNATNPPAQGGLMDLNSILSGNASNNPPQQQPQQSNAPSNMVEIYKNGDITIYSGLMKNNNIYSGSFFVSNNTGSGLSQVELNLYVKKHISCQIHATSGKDLAPNASLGIRKDVTMTNNDPNKKVVFKMEIKYVKDGNNVSESKVITL